MYERARALVRFRRARFYVTEKRGALRVENDCVTLNDQGLVRRGEIRHAYARYENARTWVRLTRSRAYGGDIDIEVDDAPDGDRLIAALRLDGASSVGEYTLTDGSLRIGRLRLVLKALGILFFLAMGELLLFTITPSGDVATVHVIVPTIYFLATIGLAVATASRAVHASVGADGVRLRQLSGTRFLPYGAIDQVVLCGREIHLELKGGARIEVHYAREHRYEAEMLVERIEGQRSALRRRADAKRPAADYLARRGRTPTEWLRALEAQHERHATFRTPVVPGERLWEILEDASAPPTTRAGAAIALRQEVQENDEARSRLRVAADACADPRIKHALESVATARHESAVLRALEPLDDLVMRARL